MAKANYNCSELELYTICNLGWKSCKTNLARFTAFKPKYILTFVEGKLVAVKSASELPDEQARNEAYETANVNLKKQGKKCTDAWQVLKRYISDAFSADLQKTKLEAAGHDYFKPASNENWDSVKGLMLSGLGFITTNSATLMAGDNMPSTFENDFKDIKEAFEAQHEIFLQAEENSTVGQDKKVSANNAIFADLMSMLLDGQEIFKDEEALLKQFVFTELLYLASGTGTAGVKGQISDANTGTSLENISVTIVGTTKKTVSGVKGEYEILQVAAGKYDILIEGDGYQTQTIKDWVVKTGTVSTLNIQMVPN